MAQNIKRIKGSDFVSFTIGKETLSINVNEVSDEVKAKLFVHGLNAKVGDSAASAKTDEERIAAVKNAIANMKNGVWNDSGISSQGGMLAQAVAKVQNISIEKAAELLEKLDDESFEIVKNHPKVKLELARIRQQNLEAKAKGSKALDLDALLK